jgi:hypothetical protein
MPNAAIHCPECRAELVDDVVNQTEFAPCPACGVPLQLCVFPAIHRQHAAGKGGEAIMVEGESSCFYHPLKKAVLPCDSCGRFLCALCDCPLDGRHFCPACLEAGRTKGTIKSLDNQRTLYGDLAIALAVLPLLIFYLTIITAPAALFVAIRYWNAPQSLVRSNRSRYVIAIFLALLEIAGWLILFIFLATRHPHHG